MYNVHSPPSWYLWLFFLILTLTKWDRGKWTWCWNFFWALENQQISKPGIKYISNSHPVKHHPQPPNKWSGNFYNRLKFLSSVSFLFWGNWKIGSMNRSLVVPFSFNFFKRHVDEIFKHALVIRMIQITQPVWNEFLSEKVDQWLVSKLS